MRKPGSTRRGFVRYNVGGPNAHHVTVYAYLPFFDPQHLFENNHVSQQDHGWHLIIDPADQAAVEYVVKVLESAQDRD